MIEESVKAERRALKAKTNDNLYDAAEDLSSLKVVNDNELESLRSRMDLLAFPGLDDETIDPHSAKKKLSDIGL